jgi:CelD/BcsL family acetyltransferase involved in cellulose biosynthesis
MWSHSGEPRGEVVSSPVELEALAPGWRALAAARGNAFLTPEWFFAWQRHYGDLAEAAVVVVRRADGRLRGIVPLVEDRSGAVRCMRFCGANLGDHFHPVARPEDELRVAGEAAQLLASQGRRWRTLVLDHVSVDAPWWTEIVRSAPPALATAAYRGDSLPFIDLRGQTWDSYMASRSRNVRSQIRRKTRRLEREHGAAFRRTREAAKLNRDLDALFALHDARWRALGGSTLSTERSRAFHRDFAATALERGWLRLWFLEVDSEPVAAWYGWRLGGRYSYYQAGFSPRWGRFSVGLVLLAHTMRSAVDEGVEEYDLLRGAEAYKARFATAERLVHTVVVTGAHDPVRLLVGGEAMLWRAQRRLPDRGRRWLRAVSRPVAGRISIGQRR